MEAITATSTSPFLCLLLTNCIAFSQELPPGPVYLQDKEADRFFGSFQLQYPETPDENCAPIKQFKRNEVWQSEG